MFKRALPDSKNSPKHLRALGHPRQARQAREMLATWVKSWLSLAVELESAQAFLGALSDVPDELIPVSTEE